MTDKPDLISEAIEKLRARAERQGETETGSIEKGPRLALDAERQRLRRLEALLFAAAEPLDIETLQARLPAESDVEALLAALQADYAERGVQLTEAGGRWRFETAPDLRGLLDEIREEPRKLSDAGLETLAIIAYHQPVTRAEIEEIRGVAVSKGTLDLLFELGWIRPRGRRRSPGRPVTYGTTNNFLEYFGLSGIADLPGLADLKAAGLLDARLPPGFEVPAPGLMDNAGDEDPLDPEEDAHLFHVDFMEEDGGND
ncbi:SMC-Scp complex subunit ScpB [Hyphobacterium sp.]|jgi:segregation and condensation protein B|uniref:SMC-Scp complex subunit ScpB n=1 Tax=Hyphobacterium sp. TaxID=2004662 RepID=UPI003BA96732